MLGPLHLFVLGLLPGGATASKTQTDADKHTDRCGQNNKINCLILSASCPRRSASPKGSAPLKLPARYCFPWASPSSPEIKNAKIKSKNYGVAGGGTAILHFALYILILTSEPFGVPRGLAGTFQQSGVSSTTPRRPKATPQSLPPTLRS